MSNKLSKFLVVILLTLLIWAWAFLSEVQPVTRSGSLEVAPTTDPALLVTFKLKDSQDQQTHITLKPLTFKGSPTKISQFLKRYNLKQGDLGRERLDFYYDPADHGRTEGNYTLDILELLRKDERINELALTLEEVAPSEVDVSIEQLVLKNLEVKCVDEKGISIPDAELEPSFVDIHVPRSYNKGATVRLSPPQREMARKKAVKVPAFVDLGVAGIVRKSEQQVQVTLQGSEELETRSFQPKSIGFVMSDQLAQGYRVEIENEAQLTSTTQFKATQEAMDAYMKLKYHLLIEVFDGDEQLTEIPPRPVIYNFPRDFFKAGEIWPVTEPRSAVIKLVPISPGTN